MPSLPAFVEPMLATLHAPFDSPQHVFEIKWDGFRSLVFNDRSGLRLIGRRKTDFTARFPELAGLKKLPPGTVLDGEIVQIRNGRPDFSGLLKRERSWSVAAKPNAARFAPTTFVAFDLLFENGRSIMSMPLLERLDRLKRVVAGVLGPRIALSDVHACGLALFAEVNRHSLEGVIAKRVDSSYEPGKRNGAWTKFKQRQHVVCMIIGYETNTTGGLKSLLLATDIDGTLRFIGNVGTGIEPKVQDQLLHKLSTFLARYPVVPCTIRQARWTEPALMCRVSFAEWTNDRKLRQPVFEAMV